MKFPTDWLTQATQEELIKQQVRFLTLVNGYLSAGFFLAVAFAIYKLIGLFF